MNSIQERQERQELPQQIEQHWTLDLVAVVAGSSKFSTSSMLSDDDFASPVVGDDIASWLIGLGSVSVQPRSVSDRCVDRYSYTQNPPLQNVATL